jgi:FkbM family methyltransferase
MAKVIRILTIAIAIAAVCGLIALQMLQSPSGYAAASVVFGAGKGCSYGEIREGERVVGQLGQIKAGMPQRMRKVGEDGGLQLWSTPQGEFWYLGAPNREDAFVLAEEEIDLYRATRIAPGSIVLDCGANYGTFTRRALRQGAAKVVAIEISPQAQAALRRTFANEIRDGKVIVYGKGVWDKDAELDLRGDSVVLPREGAPMRLPVTTIDEIVSELQLTSVDFIKMDIEGAEKNALRGAKTTLAKFSPLMAISSEHLPDDMESIPALVNDLVPGRYRMEHGYCFYVKPFYAPSNVLHFYKQAAPAFHTAIPIRHNS